MELTIFRKAPLRPAMTAEPNPRKRANAYHDSKAALLATPPVLLGLLLMSAAQNPTLAGNGMALVLDGLDDYASAPAKPTLDFGVGPGKSFTLECFFQLPESNRLGYASLITRDQAYEIGVDFRSSGAILNFCTGPGHGSPVMFNAGILKPGLHHLAAVFANNTSPAVRTLFLDGRRIYQDRSVSFPSGISSSACPLSIGGAYGSNSFRGWVQEVRLSNIARYTNNLPPSTYDTPYRIPTEPLCTDTDTVALWHFDEPLGVAQFTDASGNGNTLTGLNGAASGPSPTFQSAGMLDQAFYTGLGMASDVSPNGVYALGVLTNGQIIVGGQFTSVDTLARTNLARLNLDGSVDPSFGVSFGSTFLPTSVNAIVVMPNNQLVIGGDFSSVNGVSRSGLARLDANGKLDPTFAPTLGWIASVSGITRQPDGKLIIVGRFDSVNGVPRQNAARLYEKGAVDATFDPRENVWSGVDQTLLQPDGKLLCRVSVFDVSTQRLTILIRLNADGTRDSSFQQAQANFSCRFIALQPDGKVLLVGNFDTVDGTPCPGAARLLPDGALDTGFDLSRNRDSYCIKGNMLDFVAARPDGKILLGGWFCIPPGIGMPSVARFSPDGSVDTTFHPAEFYCPNNSVYASAFLPSGEILIAGEFTDVNGYSRRGLARLYGNHAFLPPSLSIVVAPAGTVHVDVTNPSQRPIILQSAIDLTTSAWKSVATNSSAATNRCQFFLTNSETLNHCFYRAVSATP